MFRSCACRCVKCSTDAARQLLPLKADLLASPNAAWVATRACLRHWYHLIWRGERLKERVQSYTRTAQPARSTHGAARQAAAVTLQHTPHPAHFESLKKAQSSCHVSDTQPHLCRPTLDSVPVALLKGLLAAWIEFSRLPGFQTCVRVSPVRNLSLIDY